MTNAASGFYESLADYFHLMFEDWDRSIEQQARALNKLIAECKGPGPMKILDCACGIGTQAIGFAQAGHQVVGSDLSEAAISRAIREAEIRNLKLRFAVSDMTLLREIAETGFDVAAALDNALPHLNAAQLAQAVRAMASKLKSGGLFLASIRDYDRLIVERPVVQGPAFYGAKSQRRIVHQIWDWLDRDSYALHSYITTLSAKSWTSHHFAGEYRCVLRAELTESLERAGFQDVRWLMPEKSHYYQPIVLAEKL
jgi:SAM-dependent methyltransferase